MLICIFLIINEAKYRSDSKKYLDIADAGGPLLVQVLVL